MMQTLRMQSVTSSLPSYNQSISLTSSIDSTLSSEYSLSHSFFAETPLTALSNETRRQLSKLLNSKKILRSEEGYERDWRGIAALSKQKSFCDETSNNADDPISKVLTLWCYNNPQSATFANLERYLGMIDRWDVSDDINENLVKDSESFRIKRQQSISSMDMTDSPSFSDNNEFTQGSDPQILTEDDVINAQNGLPPQLYDAFILFADSDIEYATELIQKLEEYNLKICVEQRDCLGGIVFPHAKLSQLIDERCRHLVVIFTKEFEKSSENTFLLDFIQMKQILTNTRKIIPLIYDRTIEIPVKLRIYKNLHYDTQSSGVIDFWRKLASSLQHVTLTPDNSRERYERITSQSSNGSPSVNQLPTPPCDIPSININGHAFEPDDDEEITPKKQKRLYTKRSSLRHTSENRLDMETVASLRNAHSTSQLSASGYKMKNNSLSDLSTSSISSDSKKKKKWPSKILKKVFSRSSSKLQEPA